ncbi:hypothetical protein GGS21DRAFT_502400 [Xylaria nigripes]|nr:hypothetical protein GGS21DRAFT_502400 [Xylaria nigripes]
MSSTDILKSSPPRSRSSAASALSSSSPYLPSLEEIFLRKSPRRAALRTENLAAPIPDSARTTLTSAADVLREAPEIDIDTEKITESPPRGIKPTKTRRTKVPISYNFHNDQVSNQIADVVETLSPKDKPWQKFKTCISAQQDDDPLPPPAQKASASKRQPARPSETVSRHFTKTDGDVLPESDTKGKGKVVNAKDKVKEVLINTESELAIPRRQHWTPPKAKELIVLGSDSDARELFSSVERIPVSKDVFQSLHDEYGRQDTDASLGSPLQFETDVLRKRKLIEFISTGQKQGEDQSAKNLSLEDPYQHMTRAETKAPAPRKKKRTITELAMAPFAPQVAPEFDLPGPDTEESMLKYFDSDGAVKALVEHQAIVMTQRKTKGKVEKKPSKATRKKKAGTQANPILLSPSSALKQSSDQDFVFGTSSQLVQEESPTILRDLQVAIRESNSVNSSTKDDDICRRLWQAGARDEHGSLMGLNTSGPQRGSLIEPNVTTTPDGQSFVDIDDLLDSPVPVTLTQSASCELLQRNSHSLEGNPKQSLSTLFPEGEGPKVGGSTGATNVGPRPKYELFTDAQLSKQITSYGFKPVKKRTTMIALLNQCWESKSQGTSVGSSQALRFSTHSSMEARRKSTDDAESQAAVKPKGRGPAKKSNNEKTSVTPPMALEPSSPKGSRGRPKKKEAEPAALTRSPKKAVGRSRKKETTPAPIAESTPAPSPPKLAKRSKKSSTAPLEIPDSESDTPSSGSSSESIFSSSPSLELSISEDDMSLTLPPTDKQTKLFKYITEAVVSAPRSQDTSNPSWYEKMLLYDPIILEDLAKWLNAGQLRRAGYRRKVSPDDVKQWCKKKSIVCSWRETQLGKERKRY